MVAIYKEAATIALKLFHIFMQVTFFYRFFNRSFYQIIIFIHFKFYLNVFPADLN